MLIFADFRGREIVAVVAVDCCARVVHVVSHPDAEDCLDAEDFYDRVVVVVAGDSDSVDVARVVRVFFPWSFPPLVK